MALTWNIPFLEGLQARLVGPCLFLLGLTLVGVLSFSLRAPGAPWDFLISQVTALPPALEASSVQGLEGPGSKSPRLLLAADLRGTSALDTTPGQPLIRLGWAWEGPFGSSAQPPAPPFSPPCAVGLTTFPTSPPS